MYLKHSLMALGFILASAASAQADIFRWDNGQLIPGTEGITPGPGVQLDHRELEYAALTGRDLTDSRFDFSNLSYAFLIIPTLTNANLSGAVVTGANLRKPRHEASPSGAALLDGQLPGEESARNLTWAERPTETWLESCSAGMDLTNANLG